jgi:hypothetical protein
LRFSVIGQLLAAPPAKGTLRGELAKLAEREWRHPVSGELVRFSISTIERWYLRAVKERHDPVGVLQRKVRTDLGQQTSMTDAVRQALFAQYAAHQYWSTSWPPLPSAHATLCYRAARYGLTRAGPSPAGLHQLSLAP